MPAFTVRLFAGLKETIGKPEVVIDVPEGATVRDLRDRLGEAYPLAQAILPVVVCAVDEEYVAPEHVLRAGERVAFIPPVSGGARGASY
jgi:molybdopterin converting factor subunit 1